MDDSKQLQPRATPKNTSFSQPSSTNSSISENPTSTQRTSTRASPANAPIAPAASLVVSRPPLNVYLKIAIVRSPNDVVLCEDPERPGKIKQLVIGSLVEHRRPEDDKQEIANEQRDDANIKKTAHSNKKTDIPVPTITTVKKYARDVPPTYKMPRSYIRYNHASYEQVDEEVEYNIDEEDENWWRDDPHFGPDSKAKIVWESTSGNSVKENDSDEPVPSITMPDVIIQNPRYLMSYHGTNWIIRKFRPRLPLLVLEQMMDVLEKATGFETIVTVAQAEKVLTTKIPLLKEIFEEKEPVIEGSRYVDCAGIKIQSSETTPTTTMDEINKQRTVNKIPAFAAPITLSAAIHRVYNYWMQKRSRLKKPLLRRFWPVTSVSDLNPHMVFRPRDKEKRKLRKKRQNDMESYKKMMRLKSDFEKVKTLCELIVRREGVTSLMVDLTNEYYQQRMYELLDTSGVPRQSGVLNHRIVERVLDVPRYFDDGPIVKVSKSKKRKRSLAMGASVLETDQSSFHAAPSTAETVTLAPAVVKTEKNVVIAGHDRGLPAPSFLDPLASRETYVTNWDHEVPFVPYYENGKGVVIGDFRLRPRLGRGGRIVLDRIPIPSSDAFSHRVITYGSGMDMSGYHTTTRRADGQSNTSQSAAKTNASDAPRVPPGESLQDLLPRSLGNSVALSRRIEEICAMGILEDYQITADEQKQISLGVPNDEDEVLVPVEDFLDAPPDFYGKEHFVIGPL